MSSLDQEKQEPVLPSRVVGLDPGEKNVLTMVDFDRNAVKYTTRQRNF